MKIKNPILRGFHPDPSIIRVGEDYYVATSTFEWWPGVRLHHSKDLCNWELIEYPLNRMSQLDLRGVGASQGIWAPCLTYDKGIFYLVYTVVRAFYCNMYDTHNYLVTAENIHGPWSDPVKLNNFGFDPSLFHDDDGRKYIVSMATDHRVPKKYAGRLVLQEFDPVEKEVKGPIRDIYAADKIFLEGPHIFKRNGWYYLFSADTGTGEGHGQTIQRARDVWGPYEMYRADFMERTEAGEAFSILTSRHHEELLLQKSGHCDLVETSGGEWYAVHLCGRASKGRNPQDAARFPGARRYMLGRETAIQKMRWTQDDWLVLDAGGTSPLESVPTPRDVQEMQGDAREPLVRDDFDLPRLNLEYQSLRIPMDGEYVSLTERPGWLRMFGRSGLSSKFSQSLIARRITEYRASMGARLEFEPEVFKQMAGLVLLYDTDNYLYLHVSRDEDLGKCVTLLRAENKRYDYPFGYLPLAGEGEITLRMELEGIAVSLYYQEGDGEERLMGRIEDASFLSDEACQEGWFTGLMCGICCQDLTGMGKYADFDWFEVKNSEETPAAPSASGTAVKEEAGRDASCGAWENEAWEEGFMERLSEIKDQLSCQTDSMARMWTEIREIHKLYHNEFAGRLKSMQEELEGYHEIDKGRVFDDILREIARIYCDNAALLEADADEKVKKHIKYLFMDLEQFLESNGVLLHKSRPGDKRNHKFCQVVERVETADPEKHDTVANSKSAGFYTEKRPLIRELIDVYIYQGTGNEGKEKA